MYDLTNVNSNKMLRLLKSIFSPIVPFDKRVNKFSRKYPLQKIIRKEHCKMKQAKVVKWRSWIGWNKDKETTKHYLIISYTTPTTMTLQRRENYSLWLTNQFFSALFPGRGTFSDYRVSTCKTTRYELFRIHEV